MDSDTYGPPLPPGYKKDNDDESLENRSSGIFDKTDSIKKVIGPQCPTDFLKRISSNDTSYDPEIAGPALPPGFVKTVSSDSDSEEETFGPMPTNLSMHDDTDDDIITNIEKRAKDMKRKLDGPDETAVKKVEREEWMTMPNLSSRNQLGVISRCLNDSKHREKHKKEKKHHHKSSKEEKKMSEELERYNKSKRAKSLLEMHQKAKKKKKDKEQKKVERKPFNRDDDMSLRLMSKDQVKSVIDKAKYLDSRFSRGQTKYL